MLSSIFKTFFRDSALRENIFFYADGEGLSLVHGLAGRFPPVPSVRRAFGNFASALFASRLSGG
jgi:hypothetical protein